MVMGNQGVVYVATRKEHYVAEAFLSAHSIKDVAPDLHITLYTDVTDSPFARGDCFDSIVPIKVANSYRSVWASGQLDRIKCLANSPYERTLHLDSDTRMEVSSLEQLFSRLDVVDIAMAECQFDASVSASHYGHPMFNVGVILYKRTEGVGRLLKAWEDLTRELFNIANQDEVPPVACLPHIDDPELRRKLLFMDQLSMVQLLSPEVNKFQLEYEILHESWNYRGAAEGRKLDQPVKINHHPDLRKRLLQDIVNRALKYEGMGKSEYSRELYSALIRNVPDQQVRMSMQKLIERSFLR